MNLFKKTLIVLLLIAGCTQQEVPPTSKPKDPVKIKLGKERLLWSTFYKSPAIKSGTGNFCLKNASGKCLTKGIRHDQKCFIQMQGSGIVDGQMYTYHSAFSQGLPASDSCLKYGNAWRGSGNVRFYADDSPYGKGSFNNNLMPFKSIACPKEFPNNHKFFIPAALNVKLPDGSLHDGIFICHDRGGAIKGNQIDTFIGVVDYSTNWRMFDWARGSKSNPFTHVQSSATKTFKAYDIEE